MKHKAEIAELRLQLKNLERKNGRLEGELEIFKAQRNFNKKVVDKGSERGVVDGTLEVVGDSTPEVDKEEEEDEKEDEEEEVGKLKKERKSRVDDGTPANSDIRRHDDDAD